MHSRQWMENNERTTNINTIFLMAKQRGTMKADGKNDIKRNTIYFLGKRTSVTFQLVTEKYASYTGNTMCVVRTIPNAWC